MQIIVDTREQLPLWETTRQTLIVGDYTTKKLKGIFHIERKSLSDLYGTLTSGNQRFKYELFRAAYNNIQLPVYVEGSYSNFVNKRFPKGSDRKFSTEGLIRLIATFERKYFLEFVWASNRAACRQAVQKRLQYEENRLKRPKK